MFKRIGLTLSVLIMAAATGMAGWLYLAPPALLQVGSGYAAKIVCSNVFIANRDPQEVLAVDVQAPGHPLLRLMRVDVDRRARRVDAALVGIIAPSTAVYDSQSGCQVVHGRDGFGARGEVSAPPTREEPDLLWPDGAKVQSDESLAGVVSDPALTGSGMRAVVVVKDGRIVAERYGNGFSNDTPLLGWSMTKTVNAAIIGRLAMEGRLDLNASHLFPQWEGDRRSAIRIADLLAMESGLAFNENYGTVADVTRMLFLEPDMARFAAGLPLEAEVGSRFSYSSGTSVLLARIWMDRIGNAAAAMAYPRQALFEPLGMTSAVLEADEARTFVASSHMYAKARDWARFGLLLADDGVWKGQRLLPEGFVVQMHAPNRTSGGRYSRMQTWLPAAEAGLPADAFILSGHDGQNVYVIPSMDLVILRMGLTPGTTAHNMLGLVKAVVERFKED